MSTPRLSCKNLDVRIGELQLVSALDLDIRPGNFVAIVGCNGAGKTTLMHTLAGLRDDAASIELNGSPLAQQARTDIAREIALLTQQREDSFPGSVRETVLLGRHPHLGFFEWESQADEAIATESLAQLGLEAFSDRDIATLSGGERQRVAIAAALAQRARLYLLDEPLNNLDPHHQLGVLRVFSELAEQGAAVVAILHDLNLVARFANRVLLLYGPAANGEWLTGDTQTCMTGANLSRLYNVGIERIEHAGRPLFIAGDDSQTERP